MFATITSYIAALPGTVLSVPEPMSVLFLGVILIALSESLRLSARSGNEAEPAPVKTHTDAAAETAAPSLEAVAG